MGYTRWYGRIRDRMGLGGDSHPSRAHDLKRSAATPISDWSVDWSAMGSPELKYPYKLVILKYDPVNDIVEIDTECSPVETRGIIEMAYEQEHFVVEEE